MTRIGQQLLIVVFALALLSAPLADTVPTVASQTSGAYHWARKSTPVTIQVGNNMSGGWNKRLRDAITDWNRGDTVILREVSGSSGGQNCTDRKGNIQVCNGRYGDQEGWLGLTRLYFNASGDHVEAATVQMNDSFFDQNGGRYNSEAARMHTICHEMGHAIGLDHVDTRSCMNNSQFAVFNYVEPINKDFRELARIYKHKDSTTTVAGKQKKKDKSEKKNKKGKNNRKQEAREARKKLRKRNKASSSFFEPTSLPSVPSGLVGDETITVERLDDGRQMVTYITWANP